MTSEMPNFQRGHRMARVLAVTGLSLVLVAPRAFAQTAVDPQDDAYKRTVVQFEMALKGAVLAGGQRLADKAKQIVPLVDLVSEPPVIRGIPLPAGLGLHFDVQAPDIQSTLMAMDLMLTARPSSRPSAGPNTRVVSSGGVVDPDPMAGGSTETAAFDPNATYSAFVREALVDAMLDSSGVLKLKDNEYLIVSASGADRPYTNSLLRERKLILSILGADLAAYRQGRITRDEAKAKIQEQRF